MGLLTGVCSSQNYNYHQFTDKKSHAPIYAEFLEHWIRLKILPTVFKIRKFRHQDVKSFGFAVKLDFSTRK